MRRIYAAAIGLALSMTAPGLANAVPGSSSQAINSVIQRALSQRGVPYVYGGGNTSGPTSGARQTSATVPGTSTFPGTTGFPSTATAPGATLPRTGTATLPGTAPGTAGVPGTGIAPGTATSPSSGTVGFDSSGLVQYSFAAAGIKMPRTSGEQCNVGQKVPPAQARPGDLICFGPGGSQSVAIYLGNGQMIEATEPAVTVSAARTTNMTPYLTRIITG
ncbi:NlpC/P60 family peptidoglycan-binding protein RipD [Mycobacterium talmoniae]|uniref:Hydrolase n=1 Tax=Mycobacterium talmoniae TaxID=1858794 RepID=A0A1S1NFG1_9MYCO|nr:NlpC/P60 family peptidoglycan-binding protein RipD [Mycobacterium talmoniae]OHV00240.1 hydrolase [Mycobacterium talmoniae]